MPQALCIISVLKDTTFIQQNWSERLGTHFAGTDPHDLNQDLIPARDTLVDNRKKEVYLVPTS